MKESNVRDRLTQELSELKSLLEQRNASAAAVELDQSRVGRLSRMDALQDQAMAKESLASGHRRLQLIASALRRLDEKRYGECVDCAEDVESGRLNADPAAMRCLACATAAESR